MKAKEMAVYREEQGFGVIPGVIDATEIERIGLSLEEADLTRSRAGARHLMKLPSVAALAVDERLLSIARSALGNGAFAFRATLFDKSPDANWLVAWHQDTALPLREKCEQAGWGPWSVKDGVIYAHAPAMALAHVVALRVHLDDSTAENGPLRVLPGTHTIGVLSDEELHDVSSKTAAVDCTVSRGGVVAMRPLIIHASSKSQSEKPRRVLHIEYSAVRGFGGGLELAIV
jgi:ectoine hydroxylase-related dioxygenase (phytanoyl-CoA dioxygenase family)